MSTWADPGAWEKARDAERALRWDEAARIWRRLGRDEEAEACELRAASKLFWDAWRSAGSPVPVRTWAHGLLPGPTRDAAAKLGMPL